MMRDIEFKQFLKEYSFSHNYDKAFYVSDFRAWVKKRKREISKERKMFDYSSVRGAIATGKYKVFEEMLKR